jgi:hypothetical protein
MQTKEELDQQISAINKIMSDCFTETFIKMIEITSTSMEKVWCLLSDDFPKEPKDNLLGAITSLRIAVRTLKGLPTQ